MQILRFFIGFNTVSLRSYYVVVILYLTITHIFASGVVRGGVAQPLAAVSRRLGQVSGWAERGLAGLEFWALARCVGFVCWKRSKPKAQPVCGWVRWGAVDWLEFLALARCVGLRVGRGQRQKPSHSGTACN